MKKKALTLAIAAALSAPASFAATDDSGMRYTSASEGFYASLRVQLQTKTTKTGKASIGNEGSRIGIRGTSDLGHGLEGFYRWEAEVNISDGNADGNNSAGGDDESKALDTRLGNVGLRGAFGQLQAGSFWTNDYNWLGVITDHSGAGNNYYIRQREGRSQNAVEYTTPDLNGFQGAFRLSTDPAGGDGGNTYTWDNSADPSPGTTAANTNGSRHLSASGAGEALDLWNLAAKYEVAGFTVAASYNTLKDAYAASTQIDGGGSGQTAIAADPGASAGDMKSWAAGLTYAQNNWDVGVLYTVDNTSDNDWGVAAGSRKGGGCGNAASTRPVGAAGTFNSTTNSSNGKDCEDRKTLGIAGGVTLDKVRITAAWERLDLMDGSEDTFGGVEARYRFNSNSQVDVRYQIVDRDSNPDAENNFRVVMRHNF